MALRTPNNNSRLKAIYDKRRWVKEQKEVQLEQARLTIEDLFREKTDEYERDMWRLHRDGFTPSELMRAYGTKDRHTINDILERRSAMNGAQDDYISTGLDSIFSWGTLHMPEYRFPSGDVAAAFDKYGLHVVYDQWGDLNLTVDSWYEALRGEDGNWTFTAVLTVEDIEGQRALHDKKSQYYAEANEWAKANASKYQPPKKETPEIPDWMLEA